MLETFDLVRRNSSKWLNGMIPVLFEWLSSAFYEFPVANPAVTLNGDRMDEIISDDIIPKIGMEFETEVEAYDAYMKYAKATEKVLEQQTIEALQLKILVPKLDVMVGKRPKTILTDQDQAMSAALASKWPSTYHHLCVWHIFQNAVIHLSSVFSSFKNTFAADFSHCIYDYKEESEFLDAWSKMIEKYELKDNQWLARMFSLREIWALAYERNTFCADIITTQRSECMNVVVKYYVSYKNNIVEAFHNFQRLIDDRREKESTEDFKNAQSSHAMIFPFEILKHVVPVYTHKMFVLFNEELRKTFESKIESEDELGSSRIHKVRPFHRTKEHIVTYDSIGGSISCGCRKFEFSGILCSHSLKVLTFMNMNRISDEYILKRWTKHAKNGMTGGCDEEVIVDEK
ncbi:protein FAR1-RELATED SEQUENCE 5-like [Salvia splendens]|uniref:protein FAR1-RELATED SEQUENCE 5-like n=1 Tax=Salvia splendens TaxID=180675 RepID=UPI001C25413A|nr:protein FAR1-RELATED SEQUENCE 5-like [Salvia splendens]